jgi:hypothetical protein
MRCDCVTTDWWGRGERDRGRGWVDAMLCYAGVGGLDGKIGEM